MRGVSLHNRLSMEENKAAMFSVVRIPPRCAENSKKFDRQIEVILFLLDLLLLNTHTEISNRTTIGVRLFNPFHATDLFLYPLKTSENNRFCDILRRYEKGPVT